MRAGGDPAPARPDRRTAGAPPGRCRAWSRCLRHGIEVAAEISSRLVQGGLNGPFGTAHQRRALQYVEADVVVQLDGEPLAAGQQADGSLQVEVSMDVLVGQFGVNEDL